MIFPSKPLLWLSAIGIGGALLLYGYEKVSHAKTRSEFATTVQQHAIEKEAYATSTILRAEQYAKNLQEAEAERDRQDAEANKLLQAVTFSDEERQREAREAARRISDLEAENAELQNWGNTRIPDAYVEWMREPTATSVPPS